MKKIILSSILFLSMTAMADLKSDIAAIDARATACTDEDSSMYGLKLCTSAQIDELDALLNAEYKKNVAVLKTNKEPSDKETLKRLVQSQRDWIKFRDSNSTFAGSSSIGGSLEALEAMIKVADMTRSRIVEIEQILNGYE